MRFYTMQPVYDDKGYNVGIVKSPVEFDDIEWQGERCDACGNLIHPNPEWAAVSHTACKAANK